MFYDLNKNDKKIASIIIFILAYILFSLIFSLPSILSSPTFKTFISAIGLLWYIKIPISFLFVWLLVYANNSSLDIKSKVVGDNQHGSACFISQSEKEKIYNHVDFGNEKTPGIVVGLENKNNKWIIDSSDHTSILLAPPGGGKTLRNLIPTIYYNTMVNKNTNGKGASILLTDCKGDLYRKTSKLLKDNGITPLLLDFRNIMRSLSFNLMYNVNSNIDIYMKTKDRKEKILSYAKAERYAKILDSSIVDNLDTNSTSEASSYFNETSKGLITSLILLVSEYGEQSERHIISVFKLIIELNGLSEDSDIENEVQSNKMEKLLSYIDNDRLINYAGDSIKADVKTSMNIYSSALGKLASFIDGELEQLVCSHSKEINAIDFINKPTAIFLVVPDENTTRHFFCSLFIRYFSNELIELAENKYDGVLPRNVLYLCDEFGNMPPIKYIDVLFTAVRSRNIRIVIALQSYKQLEKSYTKGKAEIIREACQMTIFTYMSPASLSTAKELSETLGKQTVMSGSISTGKGISSSKQMIARALLTQDEIITMGAGNFVVMKSGVKPMRSYLPLYFEYLPKLKEEIYNQEREFIDIDILNEDKIKNKEKRNKIKLYMGMFD